MIKNIIRFLDKKTDILDDCLEKKLSQFSAFVFGIKIGQRRKFSYDKRGQISIITKIYPSIEYLSLEPEEMPHADTLIKDGNMTCRGQSAFHIWLESEKI